MNLNNDNNNNHNEICIKKSLLFHKHFYCIIVFVIPTDILHTYRTFCLYEYVVRLPINYEAGQLVSKIC